LFLAVIVFSRLDLLVLLTFAIVVNLDICLRNMGKILVVRSAQLLQSQSDAEIGIARAHLRLDV